MPNRIDIMKTTLQNGEKLKAVPVSVLADLKNGIENFRRTANLNGFQNWIVSNLYSFEIPETGFPVRSILLLAIPHPFSAKVEFTRRGAIYPFRSLVAADIDTAERNLNDALRPGGFRTAAAPNLPLKALAAASAFARYGRNNICYIPGMGSNFSFHAWFSDMPCDGEYGTGLHVAPACGSCDACVRSCPTGAIRTSSFLIDTDRCLSFMNESGDPFPEWLPPTVHHCAYDCLRCQEICPMNRDQVKTEGRTIRFSEEETDLLASGTRFERFPPELREKAKYLGLDRWPAGIAKTLKILFDTAVAKA